MAFTLGFDNKEYLQADDFYVYVSPIPGLTREEARLIDDIRWMLQTPNPTGLITCLDEQIHKTPGDPKANEAFCNDPRVNKRSSKVKYEDMSSAQLRFFIKKMQSIHPEITTLIFKELEKHAMHAPVSTSIATLAMFSSDNSCTELGNQIKYHKFVDKEEFKKVLYTTDFDVPSPVSLKLRQQQFPEINEWTEQLNAVTNAVFISGLPRRTYGLVKKYDKSVSHGLLLNNDAAKPDRVKQAIDKILKGVKDKFGDRVRLLDHLVPLLSKNDPAKIPLFFKFEIEGLETITDPNGSKISSSKISNKILYAYVERFIDDNVGGKYIQD
jgi:hypothetical protein